MAKMGRKISLDVVRARCVYVRVHIMKVNPDTAAKAMGYRNTSVISKMEKETSKTGINHNYLQRLSEWASVSLDFLYGYSDYPERDPQTVEQLAIFKNAKDFTGKYFEDFGKLLIHSVEANTLSNVLSLTCSQWERFLEAWEKLLKLNPKFYSTAKGGATVVKEVQQMSNQIAQSRRRLEMLKHDSKNVKRLEAALEEAKETAQVDFIGFYGDTKNGRA